MGSLIRNVDWSRTSLGPIERWPQSLRSALSILLPSKAQIALFWGEDLITLYNDAYRPVFGAKHPHALGKPIRESWEELWRAGLEELFHGVLTTGEAFWAEDRPFFMERHGYLEETYFGVSYDPVRDESGRVGGVFCIVNETTGRVIGERRLRALRDLGHIGQNARRVEEVYPAASEVLARYAEDIPFALIYVPRANEESSGELHLVARTGLPEDSPAAPATMGSGSPESIVNGSADLIVLREDDLARFGPLHAGPWPEAIRQVVALPFAAAGQDSRAWLIAGISPRRALDDAYLDFLRLAVGHIATAIASARKVEDEHRRAEMLAELDRAKTTFFSNVSHELRTPLTLMLGPLEELLQKPAVDADSRELLTFAHRNSMRLLKLVNTLLDFARLEAGRIHANFEPVDLCQLTRDLASAFRSAIEKAGLQFRVDCEPPVGATYVDRSLWEKIVLNLLSNALKHTWQGAIGVTLRGTPHGVLLEVRDTGTGIPASELPHLFERFYRVPNARGRSNEGTGIGLALVHELVRLHGGTISVSSVENEGTCFTITLPFGAAHLPAAQVGAQSGPPVASMAVKPFLEEADAWRVNEIPAPMEPARTTPATGPGEATGTAARGRIVLADDNADMRDYVRHLLGDAFDVYPAGDGEEALALVRTQRPDLVLADVMMPRMDGMALLQALRSDATTIDVPVILLSARAGEEARLEGLNVGADDYLVKPFNARELLARVHAQVRLSDLRKRARGALQEAEQIRWRAAQEQLRLQRDELKRIFENTPSFMAVLSGHDLVFELANPAFRHMVGHRDVVGKKLVDALPEVADQPYPELLRRVMETGEPFIGRDMPVTLQSDGGPTPRQVYADFVYMPIVDSGQGPSVLVEGYDVTDRVQAKQQLERESKRKDVFLATLAHELRNPLAALSSAAQLLMRAEQRPAIAAVARDALSRQVDLMSRLLDDLLDLARITNGRVQLRRSVFPLQDGIEAALETSRPLIEAKRHTLTVLRAERPLWVDADRVRIAQVFSNLLTNAAKYTDTGGAIRIRVDEKDGHAVVTVADNGIGIAPDALQRVFEMFSQSTPALERSEGGLGIGLSLVRGLVGLHGGTVEARSAGPGRGSEFIVTLPLSEAPIGTPPRSDEPCAGDKRPGPQRKVLIADDNEDAAQSWATMLQLEGFETRVAFSGTEALRVAAEFQPDVALLDIGMPEMNGYELARRLRSTPAGTRAKLIAITGWGQEQDKQAARDAGFDSHLTKPVQLAQIIELIEAGRGHPAT